MQNSTPPGDVMALSRTFRMLVTNHVVNMKAPQKDCPVYPILWMIGALSALQNFLGQKYLNGRDLDFWMERALLIKRRCGLLVPSSNYHPWRRDLVSDFGRRQRHLHPQQMKVAGGVGQDPLVSMLSVFWVSCQLHNTFSKRFDPIYTSNGPQEIGAPTSFR